MIIPIEFGADLPLSVPIEIQPFKSMKNPLSAQEKPFIPALFNIAHRQGERAFAHAPGAGQTSLGEMMLDAKKLEAILKAVDRRKKTATR
jgi:hypothetical protein